MSSTPANPPNQYTWQYLIGIAMEHKSTLIKAHIIAFFAALLSTPIPLMMPIMVDEVLLNQPGTIVKTIQDIFPETWHGPLLYIGAVFFFTLFLRVSSALLAVWQTWKFTCIAKDAVYRMRASLLYRLGRISMAEYETIGSGGMASHFVTDMQAIDLFIGTSISKFVIAILTLIGVSAVLLWMNWALALFILFMNPLVIFFTVVLGKKVQDLKKQENSAFEMFQSALVETLDAIVQIRAANRERHYLMRVIDQAANVRKQGVAFEWRSDAASRMSFLVFLLGFEMFRAVAMLLVVYSSLTIGEMIAVIGYLWFMMSPVQEILGIQYSFFGAKAALARINKLLDLKLEPQYPATENPFEGQVTTSVEVDDIVFSYGDGPKVLDHLSLHIKKGEKVALVGASGGGKSTLVQVILGLYPPNSGQLSYNGIPTEKIGLERIRDNVSVVLQNPALFNESVRINLDLGRDLPDEEIWQALEIAQLKRDIEDLPNQLESLIGRQGVRLSGGQRQRLAIARMILSKPKIVVLDEATSALDTDTEARLHKAMQTFLAGRTTLIIAHRLSAVKQADRVYVFDAGCIIEEGHHDALIESGGLYSKLYGHHQTP